METLLWKLYGNQTFLMESLREFRGKNHGPQTVVIYGPEKKNSKL